MITVKIESYGSETVIQFNGIKEQKVREFISKIIHDEEHKMVLNGSDLVAAVNRPTTDTSKRIG